MMRTNASKNSSRGFQVSSEINLLISVRKVQMNALKIPGKSIGSRGLTCKKQPPDQGCKRAFRYIYGPGCAKKKATKVGGEGFALVPAGCNASRSWAETVRWQE